MDWLTALVCLVNLIVLWRKMAFDDSIFIVWCLPEQFLSAGRASLKAFKLWVKSGIFLDV